MNCFTRLLQWWPVFYELMNLNTEYVSNKIFFLQSIKMMLCSSFNMFNILNYINWFLMINQPCIFTRKYFFVIFFFLVILKNTGKKIKNTGDPWIMLGVTPSITIVDSSYLRFLLHICRFNQPQPMQCCSIYYWKISKFKRTSAVQTQIVSVKCILPDSDC